MIRQLCSVAMVFVAAIPNRRGPSLVVVAGIGGVVAVVISLFAMANGFEAALQTTGKSDRALVLRAGSTSEVNGNVPLTEFETLRQVGSIARDAAGEPLASRETYVTVNLETRSGGTTASPPMPGVTNAAFRVRPEVQIVAGRSLEPGKRELIAGRGAAGQFDGLDLDTDVRIRGATWKVVGIFGAGGGAMESEVWVDERLLAHSWQRGETFSSALVVLASAKAYEGFAAAVAADKRLTLGVFRESDFYAEQAKATSGLMQSLGILVGSIMAIGAAFAELSTMTTALANRKAELATYRALGFRRRAIVGAVLIETAILGTAGALLAIAVVYVALDGMRLTSVAATTTAFTQLGFEFSLSSEIALSGVIVALTPGLLAGLFPAVRAVSTGVSDGLRGRGRASAQAVAQAERLEAFAQSGYVPSSRKSVGAFCERCSPRVRPSGRRGQLGAGGPDVPCRGHISGADEVGSRKQSRDLLRAPQTRQRVGNLGVQSGFVLRHHDRRETSRLA